MLIVEYTQGWITNVYLDKPYCFSLNYWNHYFNGVIFSSVFKMFSKFIFKYHKVAQCHFLSEVFRNFKISVRLKINFFCIFKNFFFQCNTKVPNILSLNFRSIYFLKICNPIRNFCGLKSVKKDISTSKRGAKH